MKKPLIHLFVFVFCRLVASQSIVYKIPIQGTIDLGLPPFIERIIQNAEEENADAIIFDIQDIGSRYYTYVSTMTYVMQACAENNIKLYKISERNR